MPVEHCQHLTAIVLQGGGALGAYEYGVLKALYEERRPFTPAVVTGVSIGAINAAVLVGAREDPILALDELWRQKFTALQTLPEPLKILTESLIPAELQKYLSLWGNPGMYRLRPEFLCAPALATSVFDLTPLRRTLEAVVDLDKLNTSSTRMAVCTSNITTGELDTFRNTTYDRKQSLSLDHILASASIPCNFPMTPIGESRYWDGGALNNTPLSAAINALEAIETHKTDVFRELIVVELFPKQAEEPRNMAEVLNRATQLSLASKLNLHKALFAKFNDFIDLVQKIDELIRTDSTPEAQKIRAHPGYKELVSHRKIDAFTVITFRPDAGLGMLGDFSKSSTEKRIDAGYRAAIDQGIAKPQPVHEAIAQFQNS
jgi:NTE family protein